MISDENNSEYTGYEGKGVLNKKLKRYNMLCLEDEKHPPFPFELWGYLGFIIKNEEDLTQALLRNWNEGQRRREARI